MLALRPSAGLRTQWSRDCLHTEETTHSSRRLMRVRITREMSGDLEGLRLDSFKTGEVYDIGTSLTTYLMSYGFTIPIVDERPARIVPLDQGDVHDTVRNAINDSRSVMADRSESRHVRRDSSRLALLPFSKRDST